MAVLVLTLCGAKAPYADAAGDASVTIGISIGTTNNSFGGKCKNLLDAAAAALDVKIQYVDQGDDEENIATSVEHLAAYAGCEGIVIASPDVYDFDRIEKICDKYDIYFAAAFNEIGDENEKAASRSKLFVGTSYAAGLSDDATARSLYEFCCPLYSFMMVYRAVTGSEIPAKNSFFKAEVPYVVELEGDDETYYGRFFELNLPYSADELMEMAKKSDDDIVKTAASLSVDDAMDRTGQQAY